MDSGAEPPQEREIDHGELIDQLHWACRIADLSGVDLFITDAHSGRFLDCSRSAHERLGYSRAELLAMGAEQIQADPDHDAAWLQKRQRSRCAGQPHRGAAQRAPGDHHCGDRHGDRETGGADPRRPRSHAIAQ